MSFKFGERSEANLADPRLDPRLVAVSRRALEITEVDFMVFETLRTKDTQAEYVRTGVSKNMKSKHLVGRAIDYVPYVAGQPRWEWEVIYPMAEAVRAAWRELYPTDPLRWGGSWSIVNAADNRHFPMKKLMEMYINRRLTHVPPKKVWNDGPHFEIFT